ncbi:enoyl-CoA hydratase/isomerase family protein [Cryobacterium psychrophilum]|uniref:3-hydroxyisobutyryl-CoA hydrolase n=1 Tax=Cryobacterium psychrophilum TaxID=41988 RepID=A0A4Y8KNY1_9MICO|nr:enoyl-CoA hydratase/isomerase family protein [Cryobacterium psychrophilum]TDW31291.1 enoyl-CoA hydratase [Cryobacterium psychrophilum]TFD78422.1 enoyl-CoA hydratase/isomerase family protein [Cryobacterium psychrophilum]
MSEHVTPESEVLCTRDGRVGHLSLNRPRAINALTHTMVNLLQSALDEWADDDSVQTILLTGSGERGLCAGGDIVSLYQDALSGDGREAARFWADEYRLNAAINSYPKPYVALMDGVVLGGGVGVSAHASHRIVTERSKIGMPETAIGFVPDVGGTWLLSHTPGELGTYLALTAGMVGAGDAIALGLADTFVPSSRIPELIALLATTTADEAIAAVCALAPEAPLLAERDWIDAAFAGDSMAQILDRLKNSPLGAARDTFERIASKSPTALAATLDSLRRVVHLDSLEAALRQEYRVTLRAFLTPDFAEGVRAQVIDKDRTPHWIPATLDEVDPAAVTAFFEPLDDAELDLPDRSPRAAATTS